ncbi:hypothetical protein BpHYR1_000767 [Brachionus plicatilis]|uniref:Uncharacterized protein n=1 Tax=Brachionus plicatilis TaxID=10195 RepID=A0A3M7QMX7_BRAPC|nr:hypothetical protein BpHYR1_000767 [Brachionus plicatilis]
MKANAGHYGLMVEHTQAICFVDVPNYLNFLHKINSSSCLKGTKLNGNYLNSSIQNKNPLLNANFH